MPHKETVKQHLAGHLSVFAPFVCYWITFHRYDSEAKITSDDEAQESSEESNTRKRKATSKLAKPSKRQKQVYTLCCP